MTPTYEFVEVMDFHYIDTIHVSEANASIEIYRCPKSDGILPVDASWFESGENRFMVSPFDPHIIFDFGREEEETLEEEAELRNEWMEENIPK